MVLVPLSASFQSVPLLPTIKLGPSGAASQLGGFVYVLGPCESLQWPLLWDWEFLLLTPQPPWVFLVRGLRLYFPTLEPWVARSALLPHSSSQFIYVWMWDCRGCQPPPSGVCQLQPGLPHSTIRRHLSGSASRHLSLSPCCLAAHLCPTYQSGWVFLLYLLGCHTSVQFNFLSVLVVFHF